MNFNVLNKINEAESVIKEIRDNLNNTKTTGKGKQIQTLLLEKQKHDKQNKEYLRLKQKEEEENKLSYILEQDKKKYKPQKYLNEPYNSMGDINFDDLFNLNKINNDMLNEKRKLIENTQKAEQKNLKKNLNMNNKIRKSK
jgi:hypothetical protein